MRRPPAKAAFAFCEAGTTRSLTSGEVVAIQAHHFVPRRGEVLHKCLLRVVRRIDFRERPELGVRAEDKVDTRSGPLDFARRAITPLIHAFGCRGGLPLR